MRGKFDLDYVLSFEELDEAHGITKPGTEGDP